MTDAKVKKLIRDEERRQASVLNLIASENYVSRAVREALGSVLTNKYAEGYPGARYYGGNELVDKVEKLACERALKLFGLGAGEWNVNVQPYSGSPANLAVYLALVGLGEKIMGLRLDMGGHLTHGHKVSATGKLWKQVAYGVHPKTEMLDYDELEEIAKTEKPKLIVAGYTAYSRVINFKRFREIADKVGAVFMVDMSHIAGLVAGGVYPSPFPYADVVTTTTHKTLRGPRAALIFSKHEYSKNIDASASSASTLSIAERVDRAVFPGLQGGPHVNQIAAMAQAFYEASKMPFKKYAASVVENAKTLARELENLGWRVVSGGTDSHLFLVDTWKSHIGGKEASDLLEEANIIVNKNTIPFDERSPIDPSGIRIGTAASTTRGVKIKDMKRIALWIDAVLRKKENPQKIGRTVSAFMKRYPLP
ncbi:MAG: serine hydroxymethyltransferase [Candidatus Ryanbacteria bacterium]|nr:serine hydroxymethyltransferase [Candidatus Ryanbacteria bacterium]